MTKFYLYAFIFFGIQWGYAQTEYIVVNEDSITVSSFKKLYKDNIEGEGMQAAVNSYINFRLMTQVSEELQVDTTAYYKNNLKSYHDTHSKPLVESDSLKEILSKEVYKHLTVQKETELFALGYPNPFNSDDVKKTQDQIKKLYQEVCNSQDTMLLQAYRKQTKSKPFWHKPMLMSYDIEKLIHMTPVDQCSKIESNNFSSYFVKVYQEKKIDNVPPYDQIQQQIKDNLSSSPYQDEFRKALLTKLKDKIDVKENTQAFDEVTAATFKARKNIQELNFKDDKTIWSTAHASFGQQELVTFMTKVLKQNPIEDKKSFDALTTYIKDYIQENFILKTYRDHLEAYEPSFKEQMDLMRNTLLVNYFVEKEIYEKASNDSIGQQKYMQENQSDYFWPLRYHVTIYRYYDDKVQKDLMKRIKKNESPTEILKVLNPKDGNPIVVITEGNLRSDHPDLPQGFGKNNKIVKDTFRTKDAIYVLNEILEPRPMTVEEAGQDFLEAYKAKYYAATMHALRKDANIYIPASIQ